MNLIMFDIDGTLTQTDVADGNCYVRALEDVFGFSSVNDDWSSYPHCTDSGILATIFQERHGRPPSGAEITEVKDRFVSLLAAESDERPFQAIAGAHDMLAELIGTSGVAVSLASGAWECSARLKLAIAGLEFPQLSAAFSDDAHSREEIMELSLTRAAQAHGRNFEPVIYIGDGVWDARAARRLGFPFIGIASEPKKMEKLKQEGARHVFADFRKADSFLRMLKEVP
jgi:phosphoglycolate phosphatase-like HAD superfamily hydrolase